jgi:hypothetical protein
MRVMTEPNGAGGLVPSLVQDEGGTVIAGDGVRVKVPSGQEISFLDVVMNAPGPDGLTARFRFVAPAIAKEGGTVDFETASADMIHLCQNFALPRISDIGPQPSQIVISLSDKPVPFGEAAPDVTQFFEAYTIQDNACIWEAF